MNSLGEVSLIASVLSIITWCSRKGHFAGGYLQLEQTGYTVKLQHPWELARWETSIELRYQHQLRLLTARGATSEQY